MVTPKVREQQHIGHPNPVIERLVKLGFKLLFDLTDILPDPVKPNLLLEYQAIKNWEWCRADDIVNSNWKIRSRYIDFTFVVFFGLLVAFALA